MSEEESTVSYKDAMARIDSIIEEIDRSDHDVDALAPLVEEAATLLAHCRERLNHTRIRVDAALEGIIVSESGDAETDS